MTEGNGSDRGGFEFDKLQLKSPVEEFETFARAKIKAAQKMGDSEEADRCLAALELGKRYLSNKIGGSAP